MAARAYKHEEVAKTPAGYRVRSVKRGSHVVRVAFPPGPRRKGSGKVVEILHPKSETNPSCIVSNQVRTNPGELIIFGNPSTQAAKRTTRERAARIRGARLNPKREQLSQFFNKKLGNPGRMQVFHDPAIKKFTAVIYDPKFGNLYASGFTKKQAAQALRDRVREYRRSGKLPAGGGYGTPNPKKRGSSRQSHRRNPDETRAAVRLFEKFHGRDPKDITEKHVSAAMRKDYTALGDLEHLKVITPLGQTAQFNFEGDGVKLASSPDGKQLYCIGGNQNLSSCLDHASLEKDFIDLGEAVKVQYLARKVHANFEPVSYYHKFGEKTGARPQLTYDKLKRQIFFVGGEYFIDTKQGVSPGIEN